MLKIFELWNNEHVVNMNLTKGISARIEKFHALSKGIHDHVSTVYILKQCLFHDILETEIANVMEILDQLT